ncbi:MAG: tetratricopeptide repeat protein [Verrucomicrobiota bacterium]
MKPEHRFALVLAVLTLLLFSPTWSHQMLFWDDDVNVLQNPLVLAPGLAGVKKIFTSIFSTDYYPITYISLAIDHWVWSGRFVGYHVTQTVLHALNAALVLLLVWRWTKNLPAATAVACWFAWHPVQVESVSWIAERKNVLGTCFVLLAWLAYPRRRLVSLGCFTLAALSHALVIVMPALLILYEVCIERTRPLEAVRRTWLFFVPAGFAAVMRLLGHQESSQLAGNFAGVGAGLQTMVQVVGEYFSTLLAPVSLNNFYVERPSVIGLVVAMIWVVVWALAIWRQRRWGVFALGWFLVALLPVLQLVPHPTIRADRYLYLAMLGPFLLVALSLPARTLKVVGVGGAIWFAALTLGRMPAWQDGKTLWTDSVTKDPQSAIAHFSLAGYAVGAKELPAAEGHARRAVELNPRFAAAHERLGAVLLLRGQTAEARLHLETALKLDPALRDARRNLQLLSR